MNNVGINAVSDFCRNVATDEEVARLEADLEYRKAELARRAATLKPSVDHLVVTRDAVSAHQHFAGEPVYLRRR